MDEGELISFGVSGFVELGPNIGFSTMPFDLPGSLSARASYRIFVKGHFKITILKENDRFVRVKVTRKRERGSRFIIGGGARDYEAFEGILLFEGKKLETKILDTKLSLVPFKFNIEKKYIKSFDVGFRYDLKYPQAREAFKKSVFGSFAKSLELHGRVDPDSNEVAVERLFVKDAFGRQTNTNHRLNLEIFNKNIGKRTESIEAKLTLPNGEHLVFKESKRIEKEWKVAWGRFEKLHYNYTISLDKTAYLEGKPNSFQLIVEANIEDSHTNGKEMQAYIKQIRAAIGNQEILPDLPTHLPRHQRIIYSDGDETIEDSGKMRRARYRKSSFYYGYNINQGQLEKFISTPKEKMWGYIESAFGIKAGKWSTRANRVKYRALNLLPSLANSPLFLANIHLKKGSDVEVATRIYKKWNKLQKQYVKKNEDDLFEDIDQKIKLLSEMFSAKHFGHELLRLVMLSLKDQEMDYFLVATNDSFGRISQRGRVTTNPEYLLNLTDENIGFERLAGGFKSNPDILIKNLESKVLDDGRVQFDFELDHETKILYLKLFKTNRLQKFTILGELAYRNKTRFKKGKNTLIIDKKSLYEIEHILGAQLELNNFYSLTLSSTTDGFSWSKVATTRFHYIEPLLDIEADEQQKEAHKSKRLERRRKRSIKNGRVEHLDR